MSASEPSFLHLHRQCKRTRAKLARYAKKLECNAARLRALESAVADKMRAESLPVAALQSAIDADKRAEVLRRAAIDPASRDAWVLVSPTPEQPYQNCCTDLSYRDKKPMLEYYCCIFDSSRAMRRCGGCNELYHNHPDEFFLTYTAAAKERYLRWKSTKPYMAGVTLPATD